jgi:hypothetical protein
MALQSFKSRAVWAIRTGGTQEVFLGKVIPHPTSPTAMVYGRGQKHPWASTGFEVSLADLFETRKEARTEYRRRRAAALARNPNAGLNLTTETPS